MMRASKTFDLEEVNSKSLLSLYFDYDLNVYKVSLLVEINGIKGEDITKFVHEEDAEKMYSSYTKEEVYRFYRKFLVYLNR